MNAALARQQQLLLEALWLPRHEDAIAFVAAAEAMLPPAAGGLWQRGLKAYRSNGHALAQRALAGAYPVVAQLLGEEAFERLARDLWRHHPPQRGDVAQWGAPLAAHIEALDVLREQEPYLPDLARVEWLLHVAATAADPCVAPDSFSLLAGHDPEALTLVMSPGCGWVDSRYPAVSILQAHLEGEPSLQEAGRRLRQGVPETALVWRQHYQPRLRQAAAGEASLIEALQEKRSLAQALQRAPELAFDRWLAPAVQSGLVIAAAVI